MKVKKGLFILCVAIAMTIAMPVIESNVANLSTVEAASKVKLNKKKVTLYVGKTTTLKVKGTKQKVKWSSSKKSVATVSSKGKVKAKKKGTATITAKVGKKKYKCKVTVKEKVIPVSAVVLSETSKVVTIGSQFTLITTIIPNNATNQSITWQSINNNVATVNNGVVTAVGVGTTQIYAYSSNGVFSYCTVTVKRDYLAEFNSLSSDEKLLVYTLGKIKEKCDTDFEITEMYGGTIECDYKYSGSRAVYISYVPTGYSGYIPYYISMYNSALNGQVTAVGNTSKNNFVATVEYSNYNELEEICDGLVQEGYSLKELMNAQS